MDERQLYTDAILAARRNIVDVYENYVRERAASVDVTSDDEVREFTQTARLLTDLIASFN